MVVVKDQQRLVLTGLAGQLVDQGRHQRLERMRRGRPQQGADLGAGSRAHPVQRGGGVAPEPYRVVVTGVQRYPRGRLAFPPDPVGQQRGLAEAGRGGNQDQRAVQRSSERLRQARPGYQTRLQAGHVQLGSQQDIMPGGSNPRRGRRARLSHRRPPLSAASDPPFRRWIRQFYDRLVPTRPRHPRPATSWRGRPRLRA
jgi:hypothetical protein